MPTNKIHLFVLPFIALIITGCINRSQIEYATPEIKVVDQFVTCAGNVITEAQNRMNIPSPAAGRIVAVGGRVHQLVSVGELLARIENTDFIALQQEYLEALNLFEFYREEYTRQGDLTVENATSMKKMQIARRDYQTAELKYQSLSLQLKILGISTDSILPKRLLPALPVFSPRSGTISQAHVHIGDYVEKGDPLFEITGKQNHIIEIRIPESCFLAVKPGQILDCIPMYDSLTSIEATIRNIVPKIDPANHSATLYAEINETGKRIVTGMSIEVDIPVSRDTVFIINNSAVLNENGSPFVFVKQNGILLKIPVESINKAEEKTEITISGNLSDSVVISGFKKAQSLFNYQ